MNPLMVEGLGSIVRHGLTIAAGWLVTTGIWSQDDAAKYVGALALALVGMGWSLYQKYVARTKFVTALVAPAGNTEAQIENIVAYGSTPSVTTAKDEVPIAKPKPLP